MLLLAAMLASAALFACTGSSNPEPVTCPPCICPTCPTCPQPEVCPTCPAPVTCPPVADPLSDLCTATKLGIETYQLLAEIAEKGQLALSLTEMLSTLATMQATFNLNCQTVPFTEPSNLTGWCSIAGLWKGAIERANLYDPTVQQQLWIVQFANIIDEYCER
jgi:hypothetical protein